MRKEIAVTIDEDGRDKGKVFFIKEMPTAKSEWWGVRVLAVLARYGWNVPDKFSGMAGVAAVGTQQLSNGVFIPEVKDLMDEMLECVEIVPDPKSNPGFHRPLVEDDMEEIMTRLKIRVEVLNLHLGFSFAELFQKLSSAKKVLGGSLDTPDSAPQ